MRLPVLRADEVIRILERAGFRFIRSRGSHRIFSSGARMVVIPYHRGDLKSGTLRAIIRSSGLTVEDFRAL